MDTVAELSDAELIERIGHCRRSLAYHTERREQRRSAIVACLMRHIARFRRAGQTSTDTGYESRRQAYRGMVFHDAVRSEQQTDLTAMVRELHLRSIHPRKRKRA